VRLFRVGFRGLFEGNKKLVENQKRKCQAIEIGANKSDPKICLSTSMFRVTTVVPDEPNLEFQGGRRLYLIGLGDLTDWPSTSHQHQLFSLSFTPFFVACFFLQLFFLFYGEARLDALPV
jgi:hypothetical protein